MKHLLLTGKPGVGKTTLIQKIVDLLVSTGRTTQGFYTQEVRVNGSRTGFDVIFLDGSSPCPLARSVDNTSISQQQQRLPKVGKYLVQVTGFERHAVPALTVSSDKECFVIVDEIGKMELFSSRFKQAVVKLFDKSNVTVVGTIPGGGRSNVPTFVKSVKEQSGVSVVEITHENRNSIFPELSAFLGL